MALLCLFRSYAVVVLAALVVGCSQQAAPPDRHSPAEPARHPRVTDQPTPQSFGASQAVSPRREDARRSERAPRSIDQPDEDTLSAHGIRRLASRRLTLYSDLPTEKLQQIPEAVDQLYEEWLRYFGWAAREGGATQVDANEPPPWEATLRDWRLTGYVMADEARFRQIGLLPGAIVPFPNGQSRGREFWLHDQPTDYYRRHLLFHEATHCFLDTVVQLQGAVWHTEGLAEMLATHHEHDGRWLFRDFPARRDEVPGWGRIGLIRNAVREGRRLGIDEVRQVPTDTFLTSEWYAWCWALAAFLDGHPQYQGRYRSLPRLAQKTPVDEVFDRAFREDRSQLEEEWQLFVANLEYGYDLQRTVIDFRPGEPLAPGEQRHLMIAADQGWQNTEVWVERGGGYQIEARGRYSIADVPKTWWCEPGGISFRYYRGRPIGRLLAAVRRDAPLATGERSGLLEVHDVGLEATLKPMQAGTLYLRVGDAWGELADNRGQLQVNVREIGP